MNLKRIISGPLLSIIFLLFFVSAISGIQWMFNGFSKKQTGVVLGSMITGTENFSLGDYSKNNFQVVPDIEINAKSAISIESDLKDTYKTILEKNSNTKLSIASLTKLMTAVVILDNYSLADNITVSKIADAQDPMKQDVKLGDTMTVESFLNIMLIRSSNKAAYALAEGSNGYLGIGKFIGLMNQKAKDIGMQNTFFVDPTGLNKQNVSTANDLAKLAEYILKNKNYSKIPDISKIKQMYIPGFGTIDNTNELLSEIPDIICSKTGFTIEASGCLLLVVSNPKNNDYFINVVLGAEDRSSEMKKIINWSSTTCTQPITNQ